MKKIIGLLSTLAFLAACDAPQRTRMPGNYTNTDALGSGVVTGGWVDTTSGANGGTTSGTTSGSTGGGTTGGTPAPGFENCDLADRYQTPEIGAFGLCQSTLDETILRVRPSLTSTNIRTCLIPAYKDSTGSSTYIGQPQCTYFEANKVIQGKLYKSRSGFENYPLNGVMVMKEPLMGEYFKCMNAYVSWREISCMPQSGTPAMSPAYCNYWMPACPYGANTNAACAQEARNFMNGLCTSFKSRYANSYLDIRLK